MITLSKSGNSVTFTFDENSGYLQNGTIDVPVNSLALITDESDMATFRKSASNDIFISARYEEFGMSKAELEAWYKANMVSSGGGGGTGGTTPEEVQQMIDSSISGKTDTSAFTAFSGDVQSTLDEIETVAGAAFNDLNDRMAEKLDTSAYTPSDYSAGRGISIDSGNTISLNVPIFSGTGTDSIVEGYTGNTASGIASHAEGNVTVASGYYAHSEGYATSATSNSSHAEGFQTLAKGYASHSEGYGTKANNQSEHASGKYNVSNSGSTDADNTLFSVGNGTADNARHNAFEIRQNGDIYLTSGGTDIKLQDHLGGGGGSGGCTVDETVIYDTYSNAYYYQVGGDGDKYEYVILDNHNDKTTDVRDIYFAIGDDSNNYAEGYIRFDYPNHSASTIDESNTALTEYTTIEYISDINDFKVSVASGYQATTWIKSIQNLFNLSFRVPFYTINSGSPCTAIETDVVGLVEKVKNVVDKSVKLVSVTSQQNRIDINYQPNKGYGQGSQIKLDEIDGSNNILKPNIKVGLGTSGWTEVSFSQGQCTIDSLNDLKFRITYANDFNPENMGFNIQTSFYYGNNQTFDAVQYDSQNQTAYGSITAITTAATYEWSASTKELVITYPATVEYGGETVDVRIDGASCNCQLGYSIIKFETYGELTQPIKPYVQDTRAALGGLKLQQVTQAQYDALVSGGTVDNSTIYYIVN